MAKQSGKASSSQASDMGRKGGLKGGAERAKKLTSQERSDIAKKGGQAKSAKKNK